MLTRRPISGDSDKRQPAGTPDLDLVGRQRGGDIVGVRLDHHAVARGQRAELDEFLALHEAARRAEPGDHGQRIADLGILELAHRGRLVERNGDAGARRTDDVAADHQRLGRILHLIAERDRPAVALRRDAGEPRPFELEANHQRVADAARLGAADAAARLVRQHAEVELVAVSNTSHSVWARWKIAAGVGAPNGNSHADAVAMPAQFRHHRPRCVAARRLGLRDGAALGGAARARRRGGAAAARAAARRRPASLRRARRRFSATAAACFSAAAAAPAARRAGLGIAGVGACGAGARGGAARRRAAGGGVGAGLGRSDLAGTVCGASTPASGPAAGATRAGSASLRAAGLASSALTSTTKLKSSRKLRTSTGPENANFTSELSRSSEASIAPTPSARRELGVGQIELQRLGELQRELVLAAVGGDAGQLRQFEDEAREGRLLGDPHVDRTDPAQLREFGALARVLLGVAGAPRQFLDHLLRQAGRLAGPIFRHQIDEQPLRRGDGIDLDLARQRKAQRAAVGIAPRRADVVGRAGADAVDRDIDRPLEEDRQHVAGDADLRVDLLGQLEDEACVAVVGC